MASRRTVAVVGAGLGGLSAAVRLAHAGYRVDLYEQQPLAGGKAGTKTLRGFRFDTGPSLLTMPHVFEELFAEVGEKLADSLSFIPLSPICSYFYPDGTVLYSNAEVKRFGAEIEAKTVDSRLALERYLGCGRRIYEDTADLFLRSTLHERSSYRTLLSPRNVIKLARIGALRSLDAANRSFFRDPRLVQLFDRYATYNGSSPYKAPATLSIIPYVEHGLGGFAVAGGIYAVPAALERLARRQGVRFLLSTRVERILVRGRTVRGIRADGQERSYEIVLANTDVLKTYEELLADPQAPPARLYRSLEPSSSAVVFYWGMKENFPELSVNNIFFSADYRREFRELFGRRVCPTEPTVYVNISSKVTPGDAPRGCENWFVLVNAPCNTGQDWDAELKAVRPRILARLEQVLGRPVDSAIEVEEVVSPADIESNTGSRLGSLYGISSNSPLAAFLRHPNRSRRIRGLYFCGGSVHPGGGMPLAVLSGKIAAELVQRHQPLKELRG